MKKLIALFICALLGGSAGYVSAPVLSVWMLQSGEPEVFFGSSLALYKNTVVCDCNERPAGESAKELSKYLSTLQAAKAKNQNSAVLSQEIGLTYIRLSMVEENLQRQSQADQDMGHGEAELSALGWKDLSKTHLKFLVAQLNSEYKKLDKKVCGREDQLKIGYNLSETGHDTHVSLLTGKAQSNRANLTTSKTYYQQSDYRFDMKTFTELRNAQSVTIAYDGLNPMPPLFCYLKPYFNDPNKAYFRQAADGEL